jgi:hypothetical protein
VSTYLGNIELQKQLVENQCDNLNGAALMQHMKAGKPVETFTAPVAVDKAVATCEKRIKRFYGLHNKYRGPKP